MIFTALLPLEVPNSPVNTGTCSTHTGTVRGRSMGNTSPTLRRVRSRRLMRFSASTLDSVTSAPRSSSLTLSRKLSSSCTRSDWMPASSNSRIGSSMEYGRVMCRSPPPPSSSTWKRLTTTYSRGLTMLAKCGLTSELMYSKSTGITGAQASIRSVKVCLSSRWMTRISVAVNSRPSILAG